MDIQVSNVEPSPAERAAVDTALGAPISGWTGAARSIERDGRHAHGGQAARGLRHLLLPALHALQDRVGWVSEGGLNYVCRRLTVPPAEAWGVVTFYHLFATAPRPPLVLHVCDDLACRLRGAEALCRELERAVGPAGTPSLDGRATWLRSPCLGQCERAPAVLRIEAGERPRGEVVAPVGDATEIVALMTESRLAEPAATGLAGGALPLLNDADGTASLGGPRRAGPTRNADLRRSVPQLGDPSLVLLRRVGRVDPTRLDAYRGAGGYRALARAIELGAEGVVTELLASKLLGRGGAAFPTGRKWDAVRRAPALPHYLVCNADESEPGTFKDRLLLEEDPFALVEAMTIAAFATGCAKIFLYLRGEYPLAFERMSGAIAEARAAALLGENILGSGFGCELEIRRGGGAYICGEETALFESIEGKRGEPRSKPPFPVEIGLFGQPTLVNNVETLANVLPIVLDGGPAFAGVGSAGSSGPKLFCVSGQVERPGLYELPFGATLGELLALAGGVREGRALRAILLGGAAGVFVGPDALSTPLTFEGTRAIGATLGSGVVLVYDESAELGDPLLRIAEFFRHESCGQCVPCRVGTVRQQELLERLRQGAPLHDRATDLQLYRELAQAMRDASICGLGQTAASAIESALQKFDPFPARSAQAR